MKRDDQAIDALEVERKLQEENRKLKEIIKELENKRKRNSTGGGGGGRTGVSLEKLIRTYIVVFKMPFNTENPVG